MQNVKPVFAINKVVDEVHLFTHQKLADKIAPGLYLVAFAPQRLENKHEMLRKIFSAYFHYPLQAPKVNAFQRSSALTSSIVLWT